MTRRGRAGQWLRRTLQWGVVGFVVYTALGGPWRNYKLAHNHRRLVALIEGDGWGALYGANEDVLSWFGEPFRASLNFLGFPWSARWFGIETADPLLVAANTVASGTLHPTLWVAAVPAIAIALVAGKVFCSHLCPMRLAFELGGGLRGALLRSGVPLPAWRSEVRFGGWVLLGGLLATAFAGTAVWLFILPYTSLSATLFLAISAGTASALAWVVLFWLVVDVFVAPGFFCHNVCPSGFALEQLGRTARLRVRKRDPTPCPERCDLCHRACPYALRPKEDFTMPACDNCGRCVSACPSGKLARVFALGLFACVAIGLPTATAEAHHNKGLPHYGYFDNYPQVPVEEYVVVDGPWEVGAVIFNFQGYDRTNANTPNDVKIYLYVYDDRVGASYTGPVDVEIRMDGDVISTFRRLEVDEESVYSTRETLPKSGDYEIVARMGSEEVSLPFHVELAGEGPNPAWMAAIVAGVGVVAFAAWGRPRRKRVRRRVAACPS